MKNKFTRIDKEYFSFLEEREVFMSLIRKQFSFFVLAKVV